MDRSLVTPPERTIAVGDRVSIRQDRFPLAGLVNRMGTVVEVFRVPRDACMVHVDGDAQRECEWFFERVELVIQ